MKHYGRTFNLIHAAAYLYSRLVHYLKRFGAAAGTILFLSILLGCSSCAWYSDPVDYTPLTGGDWEVSTPEEEGLNPGILAQFYLNASKLETLYGLLVVKNGRLIGEAYFNEGSAEQLSGRQSVTKSFTSALVGIALDRGDLSSVDQKMADFFPELTGRITDPRKNEITVRRLLKMRAGYPDEERETLYLDKLFFSDNFHWIPHIEDFPLFSDPGTAFDYSNLTSHILGIIVARAAGTDLASYAQENLFTPMNAEIGRWTADADNYNWGWGELYITARTMAKFGQLYMDGGEYKGARVLPSGWVDDSLKPSTENIVRGGYLLSRYGNFWNIGYGYQWWSAQVGSHHFDYACGHGGNYIILLHDLDMIIVTTADPLYAPDLAGAGGWKYEGAINKAVAGFIGSLPGE